MSTAVGIGRVSRVHAASRERQMERAAPGTGIPAVGRPQRSASGSVDRPRNSNPVLPTRQGGFPVDHLWTRTPAASVPTCDVSAQDVADFAVVAAQGVTAVLGVQGRRFKSCRPNGLSCQ